MSLLVSLFHFLNSSKHTEKEASMHSMKFEKKKTPTQCNVIGLGGDNKNCHVGIFFSSIGRQFSYTISQFCC